MKKIIKRTSILFTALLSLSVGTSYATNEPTEVRAASGDFYSLVSDVTTLVEGDVIAIAAPSKSVVMTGQDNTNFRSYASITIEDNMFEHVNNLAEVTLEEYGTEDDQLFFLAVSDGYLSWSSGNYVKTISTADESTAVFKIYQNESGTTYIESNKDSSRKLQYNASSPRFACYGNTNQTPIAVYKKVINEAAHPVANGQTMATLAFDYSLTYETTEGGTIYKKATALSDIGDGSVIAITATGTAIAMGSQNEGNYRNKVDVSIENDTLALNSDVALITLEADASAENSYYLKVSDGYLYHSSKNNVYTGDTKHLFEVSIVNDAFRFENVSITTARSLQYNTSAPRFACYTNSQKDLDVYVATNGSVTELNGTFDNVKMAFGAEVEESLFENVVPSAAGVIFTGEELSAGATISSVIGDSDLDTFLAENDNYKALSTDAPTSEDGKYSVGGAIQVIENNVIVDNSNIERLEEEITAAVYFVIAGELVVLKDTTYSVLGMLEEYLGGEDLTEDQTIAVEAFHNFITK